VMPESTGQTWMCCLTQELIGSASMTFLMPESTGWISILSTSGINWLDLDVLSDAGINWSDLDALSDAGINWSDLEVLSDTGSTGWT